VTPHVLLPLIACLLNLCLAVVSLARNVGSRLNRVFAYFALGSAIWNFGVFMLRQSTDPGAAVFWEGLIHVGVIALPAFYYHFVLIFLDATTRHRPSLLSAYALAMFLMAFNVTNSPLFMKGVQLTYWGWAPKPGVLYNTVFIAYFNAYLIWGVVHLTKTYRDVESSFRRNRAKLILLGTCVSLAGGLIDIARFMIAKYWPDAEHIYPMGIPANMVFALMLGTSIVRYRLFDVHVFVKKAVVYLALALAGTIGVGAVAYGIEQYYDLQGLSAVWMLVPATLLMLLFVWPFGQGVETMIQKLMFSKRRGCYQTLLDLSKSTIAILDIGKLVDTLIRGLVRGVPLTHASLLVYDPKDNAYVPYREETSVDDMLPATPIRPDSTIAQWLQRTGEILVKDEIKLDPKSAEFFEAAEAELEAIAASLIVPVRIENKLIAILLLGEKVAGDIFDSHELEVLGVLANQTAISLENARLYEGLSTSNARLMEASRLKSQFLANMSHELRTPLNSVIGFSKVLLNRLDGELNDRQEAYIRSVYNSSTHLLSLINGILDFSRTEAGKLEMHVAELDLTDLVDECVETSLPLVRDKRLKLEKELPVDPITLTADRTKVKQILLNLLSNAIKFTASGRIGVTVRPEPSAVRVTVADTGIGIRAADLGRLFEPFHRLDNPLAREAGGTGLGLALSKRFVEMHGGRIWAESLESKGSTFHFTLPLSPVPAAPVGD
jgi:signal transduction histidine kinase